MAEIAKLEKEKVRETQMILENYHDTFASLIIFKKRISSGTTIKSIASKRSSKPEIAKMIVPSSQPKRYPTLRSNIERTRTILQSVSTKTIPSRKDLLRKPASQKTTIRVQSTDPPTISVRDSFMPRWMLRILFPRNTICPVRIKD